MITIKYPKREQWASIIERPHLDVSQLTATVKTVLDDVKTRGDEAVKDYELKFDKAQLTTLAVSQQEIEEAVQLVDKQLKEAIVLAHHNIKADLTFAHSKQLSFY